MGSQVLDEALIGRLNAESALAAINCLGIKWSRDSSYKPKTASGTERITFMREATKKLGASSFEMLVNRAKWYDTRLAVGGHGAISLTMHIYGCTFFSAVLKLRKAGLDVGLEPHLTGPEPVDRPQLF